MAELSGFETFTKRMVPLGKDPYVTIQKRGLMSFNKAAYVAMGEPSAVELLYNATERVVAIRQVADNTPHAYKFRQLGSKANSSTFIVAATAFANYYGIPVDVSVRRQAQIDSDGVLFIDLKDEGSIVTGARSATRLSSPEG